MEDGKLPGADIRQAVLAHRTDRTDRSDLAGLEAARQFFRHLAEKTYPPRARRGGFGAGVCLTDCAKNARQCRGLALQAPVNNSPRL